MKTTKLTPTKGWAIFTTSDQPPGDSSSTYTVYQTKKRARLEVYGKGDFIVPVIVFPVEPKKRKAVKR